MRWVGWKWYQSTDLSKRERRLKLQVLLSIPSHVRTPLSVRAISDKNWDKIETVTTRYFYPLKIYGAILPKINRFYTAISLSSNIGHFSRKPWQIGKELTAEKENFKNDSKMFKFCRSIAPQVFRALKYRADSIVTTARFILSKAPFPMSMFLSISLSVVSLSVSLSLSLFLSLYSPFLFLCLHHLNTVLWVFKYDVAIILLIPKTRTS